MQKKDASKQSSRTLHDNVDPNALARACFLLLAAECSSLKKLPHFCQRIFWMESLMRILGESIGTCRNPAIQRCWPLYLLKYPSFEIFFISLCQIVRTDDTLVVLFFAKKECSLCKVSFQPSKCHQLTQSSSRMPKHRHTSLSLNNANVEVSPPFVECVKLSAII